MFRPSPLEAVVFQPPSGEATRLVRRLGWLTSPERGSSGPLARLALRFLIAPMTQLTFFSFDIQAFLFVIFHSTRTAVLGHALFMTTENLFLLAALRGLPLVELGGVTIDAGLLYVLFLLLWYGKVAFGARLRGWFALSVPLVAALYALAGPLGALCREQLHLSPLWGVLASAMLVAFSHAAEPLLPPRTVDPFRWVPLREYLLAEELTLGRRVVRLGHVLAISLIGILAESWASLRLMHYNWLLVMMRLGYAPARYAELRGWAERAWATGHPALDFVGSGGGTFLAPDEGAPQGRPGASPS